MPDMQGKGAGMRKGVSGGNDGFKCVAAFARTRVWTTRVPAKAATRQWHRLTSAQHEVRRQAGFARLLVFGAHVLAGFGEGFDRRVEVDAVPGRDLVSRDHE